MTTDKIMARADNLDALRTAVESLVADRDALQSIVEASTRDAPGWYHRAVEYMQSHAALAQPEPAASTVVEPVAWLHKHTGNLSRNESKRSEKDLRAYGWLPLYAYPPRAALTPPKLAALIESHVGGDEISEDDAMSMVDFARAIESAYGITEGKP